MRVEVGSQNENSTKKQKPQLPAKSAKILENKQSSSRDRRPHVKDIVRQLQEKENQTKNGKAWSDKKSLRASNSLPIIDVNVNEISTNRTLEDLKAIDEDIERLRRQIEERDKMILTLKEETQAKDRQISLLSSSLGVQCTKEHEPTAMCSSPDSESCSSSSDTPTENVNCLDFLSEYLRLKKEDCTPLLEQQNSSIIHNDNQAFMDENRNVGCSCGQKAASNEMYISLTEEIKALREKEKALQVEAAELREQNDLMEFRILELEECNKEDNIRNCPSIWRERDLEDISDSGVMSLPTSEDLTSDSDQGDVLGHLSTIENKLTGVATVFPGTQQPSERGKRKKGGDCLQESGIFEDGDISQTDSVISSSSTIFRIDTCCKSCQTDFEASFQRPKSGELSLELLKLSEIQKRIQQKGDSTTETTELRAKSPFPLNLADCVGFYEEKLNQLESKIQIYESFGGVKEKLLKKRLDREVFQSYEIRTLKEKVAALEDRNRMLEEERCEFEEAENDSRLMCQRLALELQELKEAKALVESDLQRLKLSSTPEPKKKRKKGDAEGLVSKLRQEVEELRNKDSESETKIKELESLITEKESKMESLLQSNLQQIAADSVAIKQDLDRITAEKGEEGLKEKIAALAAVNGAFVKALTACDEVWADMEDSYKRRLNGLEKEFQDDKKVAEEEISRLTSENLRLVTEISEKCSEIEDLKITARALNNQIDVVVEDASCKLEQIKVLERELKILRERENRLNEELNKEKRESEKKLQEKDLLFNETKEALDKQVSLLKNELEEKTKEVSDLEVTTSELREEVETLETQYPPGKIPNLNNTEASMKISLIMKDLNFLSEFSNLDGDYFKPGNSGDPWTPTFNKFSLKSPEFEKVIRRSLSLVWSVFSYVGKKKETEQLNHSDEFRNVENEIENLSLENEKLNELLEMYEQEKRSKDNELMGLEFELKLLANELDSLTSLQMGVYLVKDVPSVTNTSSTSLPTLQLALDNLHLKCRKKNAIIKTMLDAMKKYGNLNLHNALLNGLSNDLEGRHQDVDFDRTKIHSYLTAIPPEFNPECQNIKRSRIFLPYGGFSAFKENQTGNQFNGFNINITTLRKIGMESLYVTWEVYEMPPYVTGYEVCVNGEIRHRVRSGGRNSALLHTLSLSEHLMVSVHPIGDNGRLSLCSTALYKPSMSSHLPRLTVCDV